MSLTALPPWDNSAMDGYAIRAADVATATDDAPGPPRGHRRGARGQRARSRRSTRGTAIRIATGAPIPPRRRRGRPGGADDARGRGRDAGRRRAAATRRARSRRPCSSTPPSAPGTAIRRAGDDLPEAVDDPRGRARGSTPAAIALAAGSGNETVHGPPPAAGRDPRDGRRGPRRGRALGPAGIPDANGPGLAALAEEAGGEALNLGIAADRLEDVRARLCGRARTATSTRSSCRAACRSGRTTSSGRRSRRSARMELWRVAVQPGQAVRVRGRSSAATAAGRCCSGCPGNPVSSFVTFELFVRPAIRRLAGLPRRSPAVRPIGPRRSCVDAGRRRARAGGRSCGSSPSATAPARRSATTEGRVRVRLAGGAARAGEPRPVGAGDRRCARDRPRGRSNAARPASPVELGGSTATDARA